MGSRLNYAEVVKKILQDYADFFSKNSIYPLRPIFDDEHQSYLLLDVNWHGHKYIHHTPIHVDIINNKIWIQYDDTEEGIATDLLAVGVPAQDIVLGFRPAEVRPYTEFAVA